MNTKKFFALTLMITLCCGSLALAEKNLPVIAGSGITLFKEKKPSPTVSKIQPAPPAPAALSKIQIKSNIHELQKRISPTHTPPKHYTIKKITLSPNKPMLAGNYFEVWGGDNSSRNNFASVLRKPGYTDGCFSFSFNTVPGKTYLVDFSLITNTSDDSWFCWGNISGNINTVNGHLIAGFTATESRSGINIMPPHNVRGYFYGVELIAVD